jgi:DNA polymerase III epsilon subunit-like protein
MTNITLEDVSNAPTFSQVYKSFKKFISTKEPILCVWGSSDLKELYRNINFYGLPSKSLPKEYINVQKYASDYFNNPSGKSIGLQNAISLLGVEDTKSYHNALNDAYYTAQVFMRIYNPTIVPDVYIYTTLKSSVLKRNSKKEINYDRLFNEFSKILNRDLTLDEKMIIDLAYKMGKNDKFTKTKKI